MGTSTFGSSHGTAVTHLYRPRKAAARERTQTADLAATHEPGAPTGGGLRSLAKDASE